MLGSDSFVFHVEVTIDGRTNAVEPPTGTDGERRRTNAFKDPTWTSSPVINVTGYCQVGHAKCVSSFVRSFVRSPVRSSWRLDSVRTSVIRRLHVEHNRNTPQRSYYITFYIKLFESLFSVVRTFYMYVLST